MEQESGRDELWSLDGATFIGYSDQLSALQNLHNCYVCHQPCWCGPGDPRKKGICVHCKGKTDYAGAIARLDAVLRDVASLRLRVEEVLGRGIEAPGPTPEEEAKASEEAAERAHQREEAFRRMREEQGKSDEVDEEDREQLGHLWLLS